MPLSFGGPYVGLFATREKFIRQMPGRLAGQTVDADGRRGWVLTLSTREQHIRREKATSNICTNSGLCALAFTIHLTLLGEAGLTQLAALNHATASRLADRLGAHSGRDAAERKLLQRVHPGAAEAGGARWSRRWPKRGILAGVPVSRLYPERCRRSTNLLLVAATETKTDDDIAAFDAALQGGAEMSAPTQTRRTARVRTISGNRGLQIEEPLIFEQGMPGRSGVDLPATAAAQGPPRRPEAQGRDRPAGPVASRRWCATTRGCSQKNYAIDMGVYPLGSCTMKHNPRLNEKMARLPGFADLHPLQPVSTVQGALELIDQLAHWLKTLTGMPAVAMSPAAGAHGELCGIMTIRAALAGQGRCAQAHPGAGIRARHQSGDGGRLSATRSIRCPPTTAAASISPPSRPSSAPTSPAS